MSFPSQFSELRISVPAPSADPQVQKIFGVIGQSTLARIETRLTEINQRLNSAMKLQYLNDAEFVILNSSEVNYHFIKTALQANLRWFYPSLLERNDINGNRIFKLISIGRNLDFDDL